MAISRAFAYNTGAAIAERGVSAQNIGKFYQSELGKSVKTLSREQALEVLDKWILTQQ